MKKFNSLLEKIRQAMTEKSVDYPMLISMANEVIYCLLSIKTLNKLQKNLLWDFCLKLQEYTEWHGTESSQYSKDFEYNTCDYRIAREITLRFKNDYEYDQLRQWANHYHYDGIL